VERELVHQLREPRAQEEILNMRLGGWTRLGTVVSLSWINTAGGWDYYTLTYGPLRASIAS
jgi:hypothetical protein